MSDARPQPSTGSSTRATGTLDLTACAACGTVAEVGRSFEMPGLDGPESYVRTRCLLGHTMVGPEFALRRNGVVDENV